MIRQDWSTLKKLMFAKTAAAGAAVTEATATGNPLTFLTDLASPLKSLLIPFTPVQSGTGDPSSQNVRPIVPWNGLNVNRAGKNWFDENVNQSFTQYKRIDLANPIPAGTYVFTATVEGTTESSYVSIAFAKEHNVLLAKENINNHERGSVTFTVADEVNIIYLYADIGYAEGAGKDITYSGILITSEAPTETSISFPSPVYGGTLDVVSGVLTVEWVAVEFDGSQDEEWSKRPQGSASAFAMKAKISGIKDISNVTSIKANYLKTLSANETWGNYDNWISQIGDIIVTGIQSITTVEAWNAYLAENPLIVVYELATPTEQTLTGHQITALVGDNTIWSDADGSMTATYLKKG